MVSKRTGADDMTLVLYKHVINNKNIRKCCGGTDVFTNWTAYLIRRFLSAICLKPGFTYWYSIVYSLIHTQRVHIPTVSGRRACELNSGNSVTCTLASFVLIWFCFLNLVHSFHNIFRISIKKYWRFSKIDFQIEAVNDQGGC